MSDANTARRTDRTLLNLGMAFFRIGVTAFGGGASVIPVLRHEVVDRYKWLTPEEFLDAYMLGSTMPGPIGSNLAGYLGHRIGGVPGAIISLVASCVPVSLAIILLASLYTTFQDHEIVKGLLLGIRPVVLALLLVVVWDFLPAAVGPRSSWTRRPAIWLLIVTIFFLAVSFHLNAAILISLGGAVGLLLPRLRS